MLITINTDKQLIRVDTWDEIIERAGFTSDLDPKQHELKAIIGRYAFLDKLRCGLSSCHTLHNRGYIVVTKSGLETNIAEKGVNLSGGEKQRLALARGIFFTRSSQVILLDEPTSSGLVAGDQRHHFPP